MITVHLTPSRRVTCRATFEPPASPPGSRPAGCRGDTPPGPDWYDGAHRDTNRPHRDAALRRVLSVRPRPPGGVARGCRDDGLPLRVDPVLPRRILHRKAAP